MFEKIDDSWKPILGSLYREPLNSFINEILPNILYYPDKENIFKVFQMPLKNIKVVILGQNPYSTPGMSTGLAFENGIKDLVPPALEVIYKEIQKSTNCYGDISKWSSQGVFLLNTTLTVESGGIGSHLNYWKDFINAVITYIAIKHPTIWILLGKVQSYQNRICNTLLVNSYDRQLIKEIPISNYNYILSASHPATEIYSENNAGFYGSDCFYKTNMILSKQKSKPINW